MFDTGQVLKGLLAAAAFVPESREAARRAADYLLCQMVDGGRGGFGKRYRDRTPEAIHLYVLSPLYEAGKVFREDGYSKAAGRCLEFYIHQEEALRLDHLTHFLAYELEALIDIGRAEASLPILDALREQQGADGSVAARSGAKWVCSPGLAQLAVCWYKLGQRAPADRAVDWLDAHQQPSGGFLGSYGPGATYFSDVEPSWATKFYLDAMIWRTRTLSGDVHTTSALPSDVTPHTDTR